MSFLSSKQSGRESESFTARATCDSETRYALLSTRCIPRVLAGSGRWDKHRRSDDERLILDVLGATESETTAQAPLAPSEGTMSVCRLTSSHGGETRSGTETEGDRAAL